MLQSFNEETSIPPHCPSERYCWVLVDRNFLVINGAPRAVGIGILHMWKLQHGHRILHIFSEAIQSYNFRAWKRGRLQT